MRSSVNFTSADVMALLSSNLTLGFRWKVKTVCSGLASNVRANAGAGWSWPRLRTRVSNNWSTTITALGSRASRGSRLGRPTTPT
jgi:hypothetical protein